MAGMSGRSLCWSSFGEHVDHRHNRISQIVIWNGRVNGAFIGREKSVKVSLTQDGMRSQRERGADKLLDQKLRCSRLQTQL